MLNRPVTRELGLCTLLPSCHSLTCSQTWTPCSRTGMYPNPMIQEEKGKRNKIPRGHIWSVTTADVFCTEVPRASVFIPGWRHHLGWGYPELSSPVSHSCTHQLGSQPWGQDLAKCLSGPLCVLDYGNRDDKKRGNPWVSVLSTGLPFPGRRSLHTGTTLHSGSGGVCLAIFYLKAMCA